MRFVFRVAVEVFFGARGTYLRLKYHKGKDDSEYDLVGPKGKWKMGAGSEVLADDQVIADFMGDRFENK